jgi:O-antigen/teichoic acid export membrane protein
MLADPLTKILLSRFSGNITLGYYEMASKFITQLRQIIAGMCQVTIPIVSHFVQIKISEIRNVYNTSFSFLVFVAFPLFTAIILFTPHLSRIWIGNVEPIFVNCAYILDLGMLINILCAPAYFNSLGEGKLNGVLYMSGIVLFLIAILGFILGKTVQDYGVVISYALSTGSGSIFLIRYYHKLKNISFKDLLKFSDYSIIICSLLFAGITIFLFTNFGSRINFNIKSLICFILIYLAIFVPIASLNANFKLLDIRQYFKS